MTARTQTDFEGIYSTPDDMGEPTASAVEDHDAGRPGESKAEPASERLIAARAQVRTTRNAAEEARAACGAAEDALVDAESEIAVLETKVEDYERDETKQPWERKAARAELARAERGFRRAGEQFERAQALVAEAENDAEQAHAELQRAEQQSTDGDEPVLRFASVAVFVEQYVLPNWVHRLGDNYAGRWCAQWWEHAEAITRLEAVWEAFEVMRLQPAPSLSTWIRDHLDPHMRSLTAGDGVFWRCEVAKHKDPVHAQEPQWPAITPPPGLFVVDDTATVQDPPDPTEANSSSEGERDE